MTGQDILTNPFPEPTAFMSDTDNKQMDLLNQPPRERIMQAMQARRNKPGFYSFLTYRSFRQMGITGDELRAALEPMEASGEVVLGIIHHCPSSEDGFNDCSSRPHFLNRKQLPNARVIECAGCGEMFHMDEVTESIRDPFSGRLSEITMHLPEDSEGLAARRIGNYNIVE